MSDQPNSPDFKKALILQGDWEAGLCNVALDLMDTGKQVTKVIFHAGDWIYRLRGVPCVDYDQPIASFEAWLRDFIEQEKIDCVILYNQYRPYNQIGWDLAREFDLECIVLELGLLRPDYCSIYSRNLDHFNYLESRWENIPVGYGGDEKKAQHARLGKMSTPCKMAQFAFYYSFARFVSVFLRRYRYYVDQLTMNFRHHLVALIRGALRFQGREKHKRFDRIFSGMWSGKYYIVPLQVHSDSQITRRSNFKSMEEFIERVADSFVQHAPSGTKLVFKVHPMDRGYRDYRTLIKALNAKVRGNRILYLDRIHLPTTLDHAKACITINSSVGLSALIHGTPVICLGSSAYDLENLTYQGKLDTFWQQHGKVNKKAVRRFIELLKETSQAHGTLFQRLYASPGRSKIMWPDDFASVFTKTVAPAKTAVQSYRNKSRLLSKPTTTLNNITV